MKKLIAVAAVVVISAHGSIFAQIQPSRLQSIADRIHVLGTKAVNFWKKQGPDPVYGGFLGTLDRNGVKTTPTDKGIVQEARHLWMFSRYYQRREATDSVKTIADDLYNFIIKYFRDSTTDRFNTTVTETGTVKDESHQLYMDGFAMYALSQYSMAFNKPEAANYALKCFRAIDKTRHDTQYGGYIETSEPNFLTYGGAKETNTQMHLMETFTTLYEATADTQVKARLIEMVNLMITKVRQPQGYDNLEFALNWTPVAPAIVSFGHDIEAAWLLMEAARVLGTPNDTAIISDSRTIGTFSAQKGWHAAKGGYYTQGQVASSAITDSSKTWWVQAEAMQGLWWMYKFTNDTTYINRLEGTLSWIEQYQLNAAVGEWYWTCKPDGTVTGATTMGDAWKASYHSMRSLINTEDWIRDALATTNRTGSPRVRSAQSSLVVKFLPGRTYLIANPFPGPCRIEIVNISGSIVKISACEARSALLWYAANAGVYFLRAVSLCGNARATGQTVVVSK